MADQIENNKPAREERIGSIKAALWRDETQHGARYGAMFSRL